MKIKRNNPINKLFSKIKNKTNSKLTFGGHLEVLRQMLFRLLGVTIIVAVVVFLFKDIAWKILIAPSEYDFVTYHYVEKFIKSIGFDFKFEQFEIELIATELSSQFMMHITTSIYLACLIVSPYILSELFCFIFPALHQNERKNSVFIVCIIYFLFIVGVLMSYFVIFPFSFRFLGTYSVADKIESMITLKSYVSTFMSLTLVMGIVFQLPILIFILVRLGVVNYRFLSKYRKYAFFIIIVISAIITPPDIITCILVSIPLYLLYECSFWVARKFGK
jgi:sec-independent protein translocase protein TatC